jgi:hypothetical protein
MSVFTVQTPRRGYTMAPNATSTRVEIAFTPGQDMHGGSFPISGPLTTEAAINQAIDNLISELNALRPVAKKALSGS